MNISRLARAEAKKRPLEEVRTSSSINIRSDALPDRPMKRFLTGFIVATPLFWIAFAGYGSSSALGATVGALLTGVLIGTLSAIGKKTLAYILAFLFHGGI